MDNNPKDTGVKKAPPVSGEIYTKGGENTSYGDVVGEVPETKLAEQPFSPVEGATVMDGRGQEDDMAVHGQQQQGIGNTLSAGGEYGSEGSSGGVVTPPPYTENRVKKFIILIILLLLIGLLVFFFIRFLQGRMARGQQPEKKINLVYWGLWEDDNIIRGILDDYQRLHPNITVDYRKQNTTDYRERLQAAIERGEGPDIFRFHNTWLPMLIRQTAPMPKEIYSNEEFAKVFYPVVVKDLTSGGYIYGIPLEIDGLMMFYNEDILRSANVPVPVTWLDVRNASERITVKEKEQIVTSAVALGTWDNIEHASDILSLMMLQNGTKLSNGTLFACKDTTKTDCAVDALIYYRQFTEVPGIRTWDGTMDNSIIAFSAGRVAIIFAPSWEVFAIKELSKNTNLNFKTAPMPQLCTTENCTPVHWASYWAEGVSNKSPNQKAAWDLLKYMSSIPVLEKLYSEQVKVRQYFGEPYPRTDMADKLKDNIYISPLLQEAPHMQSFYTTSRTHDGTAGINTSLNDYLGKAVNSLAQGVSPESALRTVESGFREVLGRFGLVPAVPAVQ